ncbi:MAG: energy-coupling factor transporter ATPase [Nitrososphaerota archaeon]
MFNNQYDIEVENLWWKYATSKDWILKNISIKIRKGEFLGIVGPSGAGKTTLCLCMSGLIPLRSKGLMNGKVLIKGLDTRNTPLQKIISKVGIVFQDPDTQLVTMSVEDEVAFPLENMGFSKKEIKERVEESLKIVGLEEFKEKYPYELSGGQKQRLAIASILALKPEILILDEPTSDLDPIGKKEIFSILSKLRKEYNATLIVVEHNTEELAKYADRIVLLYNGEIVKLDIPNKFFKDIDFLKEKGVYPPQVSEFFYYSKIGNNEDKFPVTLEEAISMIKKRKINIENLKNRINYNKFHTWKNRKLGEEIIDVKDLFYEYPDGTIALKGINFKVHKGEYIAIVGPNGSGKTTLAKHLVALLKPTKGEVKVFGENTKNINVSDLATKIGYVYQNPDHQLFSPTVYEECAYGLRNLGFNEKEIKERIEETLKIMGLNGLENIEPFMLSKGQRQRLALAATLVLKPEVIIVDEPTTGQDMKQSEAIMELLDKLNKDGKTIIVITHNMRIVAEHIERTIVLMNGKIILDGNTREVFSNIELLKEASIDPPQITLFSKELLGKDLTILNTYELLEILNYL